MLRRPSRRPIRRRRMLRRPSRRPIRRRRRKVEAGRWAAADRRRLRVGRWLNRQVVLRVRRRLERTSELAGIEPGGHQPGQRLAVGAERPGVHRHTVRARSEYLVGQHFAVRIAGDLADRGDSAPPVGELLDVDEQVQHLGDLAQHRIGRGGVGRALCVDQDLVDGRLGAAGVNGAQRAVHADAHRLQQLHDLAAAHLADDDPVGRHPQGRLAQVVHADFADALGVGGACLERERARVQAGFAQMQLERVLDGHHQVALGHLGQQGPDQRGLARPGAADHQHVRGIGRVHRAAEQRQHLLCDRARRQQLLQRRIQHAVTPDHHGGVLGHRGDGEQPMTRSEPQVEYRRGHVEAARGLPSRGRQVPDHRDQLFLAARHRGTLDAPAVSQGEDHLVVAEHMDILHVGPLEQGHQRAAAHQAAGIGKELPACL